MHYDPFFSSTESEGPKLVLGPEDVTTQLKQKVMLRCCVDELGPNDVLEWWMAHPGSKEFLIFTSNQDMIDKMGVEYAMHLHPGKYGIVRKYKGQYDLKINSVVAEDHGHYICRINQKREYRASLTVVEGK